MAPEKCLIGSLALCRYEVSEQDHIQLPLNIPWKSSLNSSRTVACTRKVVLSLRSMSAPSQVSLMALLRRMHSPGQVDLLCAGKARFSRSRFTFRSNERKALLSLQSLTAFQLQGYGSALESDVVKLNRKGLTALERDAITVCFKEKFILTVLQSVASHLLRDWPPSHNTFNWKGRETVKEKRVERESSQVMQLYDLLEQHKQRLTDSYVAVFHSSSRAHRPV